MRLPAPLLRRNPNVHKNDFGHVLILAGSARMLGAAALTSLAAIRSGAGLVTVGIPASLNSVIQKKISPVIMTLPLPETRQQSLAVSAFGQIEKFPCDVLAIGPGLSLHPETQKFVHQLIAKNMKPIVIDADVFNTLSLKREILLKTKCEKILTPHPGEMARLTKLKKEFIEKNRLKVAEDFSRKYRCTLVLKGPRTVVVSASGQSIINKTGNAGMATAGSGDVLTGMIAAFLGQGMDAFNAAKYAIYLHGVAGDLAAKAKTKTAMIATDIIDQISTAFLKFSSKV